jgi:hypothetical protein
VVKERRSGAERRAAALRKLKAERRSGLERRQGPAPGWGGEKLHRRVLLMAQDEDSLIVSLAKKENRKINSLIRELVLAGIKATGRVKGAAPKGV